MIKERELMHAGFLAKCNQEGLETVYDFDTDTYLVGIRITGRFIEDANERIFPILEKMGKAKND